MATGEVHAQVSLAAAAVLIPVTLVLTWDSYAVVSIAAGCLYGIIVSPDADVIGVTIGEKLMLKYTLGIGYVWLAIWSPYAKLCPKHRHVISHIPIISTLLRFLYLWGVFALITPALNQELVAWMYSWLFVAPEMLIFFVVGTTVSDTLHWFWDGRPILF